MTKTNKDFIQIGQISKTHGIKGELFIHPLNQYAEWPLSLSEIFIGDSLTAFKVIHYSRHKKGFIFKLKELVSIEQSEPLKGKSVYLPKDLFTNQKSKDPYLLEILNFQVQVKGKGLLGVICSFKSTEFQDYLVIKKENESENILIPFVQDYIASIDISKKQVTLHLPEEFPGLCND